MKILSTLALSLALASAATSAHADAPAAKGSGGDVDPAAVKQFIAFFDKLVDTIVGDKDSCPKMAKDINGLIDSNQDLITKAAQAEKDGKKLPADAQKHMQDSVGKIMPAMQKCGQDKDVMAAFNRLDMKKGAK